MAILTDLPNELLLPITADVSPLYIETFALSCKRIYDLCTYTIREHNFVRSRLPMGRSGVQPTDLLRSLFRDPGLALYPKCWELYTRDPLEAGAPKELIDEINTQILQGPYTTTLKANDCAVNAANLVIPLLITRLLNLREIKISAGRQRYLLETVSKIVEASYDPVLSVQEHLPLGRLTQAHVQACGNSTCGMKLGILLAMIPTLRKLQVRSLANTDHYTCPYPFQYSGVTDMSLDGFVDLSFVVELVRRTQDLQKFTYTHEVNGGGAAELEPRRLAKLLEVRANSSLLYLNIQTRPPAWLEHVYQDLNRTYNDLSLGSLRGFSVLSILVTCVDMFIETHGLSGFGKRTGTVQSLVSWLPASLEALVLHKGLGKWETDVLRTLLRGLRSQKLARLPKLKLINFVECSDFDQVMPKDLKAAFRETGVKICYTWHFCRKSTCPRLLEPLQGWEGRPWIEALGDCCGPEYWR